MGPPLVHLLASTRSQIYLRTGYDRCEEKRKGKEWRGIILN